MIGHWALGKLLPHVRHLPYLPESPIPSMREKIDVLTQNLARTIVGKHEAIRLVVVALLGGGHTFLEDVPGVGKTLLAKSLARSVDGRFQQLQCTPDLLPTDHYRHKYLEF